MAQGKKSFIAYCEWRETFQELSDAEAGRLIKHLFDYVNDLNPETEDKLTKMCFIPIKQSLKRDLLKYDDYIDKQRINGAKGGRPKNPTLSKKTQPFLEEPKKADNVNVNVNDSVIKKEVKGKNIRFIPPSLLEIEDYFFSKTQNAKLSKIHAEKFFNYYESNGWKVGKNKMKKWTGAVSGWISRQKEFEKEKSFAGKENELSASQKLNVALGLDKDDF